MEVIKYDVLGKTFKNKKGYEFVVEEKEEPTSNGAATYKVHFTKSGYIAHNVTSGHIRAGEVKDYFSPSVHGVGCLGYAAGYAKRKESRRLYYTWRGMLRRCYDKTYSKYKWYGEKGVTVCERWHRLDYFLEDIQSIPGFDLEKFENSEIELDKDAINYDKREYSLETCTFMTHGENVKEAWKHRKKTA